MTVWDNIKNGFTQKLLGVEQPTNQDIQPQYSPDLQNYLDGLENQGYMQKLLSQPKEKALTLDQYKQGITQGLNYGVPEIAEKQKELGITIPQTGEEINNAQLGQFNQYPMIRAGVTNAPREGGLLNDLASGYRENYNNRFSVDNLAPNPNKGWATRIGEGLGTVGRFLDSPLGRGLMTAGLVSMTGGNGLQAMTYGATAGVGRQNAQTADSLYRQQLAEQGIDTSDIAGNLTDNLYQRILHGQQLKDNAEYRNLYLQNQQNQQNAMQQYRQDQLDFQRQKTEEDRADKREQRALTRRGQDLNYSLGQQKLKAYKNINKNNNNNENKIIRPIGQNITKGTNKNQIVSKLKNAGYTDIQIQQYLNAKGIK